MAFRRNSPGGCTSCTCAGTGPPPGPGNYLTCICQGTPESVSVTVAWASGEGPSTYQNTYQDSALKWYTMAGADYPGYLTNPAWRGGAGYYSIAAWSDDFGSQRYYKLICQFSQYSLGVGAIDFGLHQAPAEFYHWSFGGGSNSCNPFSLTAGGPESGSGAPTDIDAIG